MIPIEFLWLVLIFFWGMIGAARTMAKELGTASILLLSLFTLNFLWERVVIRVAAGAGDKTTIETAFFGIAIVFVAYISYEGVVLSFPLGAKGLWQNIIGYVAGLFNGYLIIGTLWNLLARVDYFQAKLNLVSCCTSDLHAVLLRWLPLTLMDRTTPFVFLVPGMFLLLLIVMK